MTDVYIVTLSIIGILLSLPALLVALNLLLPNITKRAEIRLTETPGRCFLLGLPVAIVIFLWFAAMAEANNGPLRATAVIVALLGMGFGTIGGAGMARLLGKKISRLTAPASELTQLIRGAILYELAALVPIVGWLLFAPIMAITVLGASAFAFLKWMPRTRQIAATEQGSSHETIASRLP